jgi:KUP system potassium uptake protein
MLKVYQGGWLPLLLGGALFLTMTTWQKGRTLLRQKLRGAIMPLESLLSDPGCKACSRAPGTAVFMSGDPRGTPLALLHNLKHNAVLHERNVVLTIVTGDAAHADPAKDIQIVKLGADFYRVTAQCGFMDKPDVPELLRRCRGLGLEFDLQRTTFFLSSETVVRGKAPGMARWRSVLFAVLARNAQRATAFFSLPPNRVVELGMQVEI